MYNPELSDLIARLEYFIINDNYTDEDIDVYNRLIYGEKVSKRLIAKLVHRMDKKLVS